MTKQFILWGGTGQANVLYEALLAQEYEVVAIVDKHLIPSPVEGLPLLVGKESLMQWLLTNKGEYYGAAAIGGEYRGKDRLEILALFALLNINTESIIHPHAFIAKTATIGTGSQILAKSCICANASLGKGVIVNTSSIVEHDSIIEDAVHIAPGATLAGCTHIGTQSFIGAGTTILPRVKIGNNSIIGAGSVVTCDIPSNVIAIGSPARIVKLIQKSK